MTDQALLQNQLPFDLEAEKSVLGSLLRDPQSAADISATLNPDDFYTPRHRELFQICLDLDSRSAGAADSVTVAHEIERRGREEALGGRAYLKEIMLTVPSLAFLENHIKIVRDTAIRRALLRAAEGIQRQVAEGKDDIQEVLSQAEREVYAVGDRLVEGNLFSSRELVEQNLENLLRSGGGEDSMSTGFTDLDEKLGFRAGDLVVLAARPSMGKTAFGLNIAERVTLGGSPTLLFSLEMPAEQILMRMISSLARVKHDKLRRRRLDQVDEQRVIMAADKISAAPLWIDHSSMPSLAEIRAKARRLKREVGLKLVVLDYLQLMSVPRVESRQQEISIISRSLKGMARELGIPVLALAQLNRKAEDRSDHRPMLSDLRESGAIEQDADLVMLLYREDYYKGAESERAGLTDVLVAKNRHGSTGDFTLRFTSEIMRFENFMAEPQVEPAI